MGNIYLVLFALNFLAANSENTPTGFQDQHLKQASYNWFLGYGTPAERKFNNVKNNSKQQGRAKREVEESTSPNDIHLPNESAEQTDSGFVDHHLKVASYNIFYGYWTPAERDYYTEKNNSTQQRRAKREVEAEFTSPNDIQLPNENPEQTDSGFQDQHLKLASYNWFLGYGTPAERKYNNVKKNSKKQGRTKREVEESTSPNDIHPPPNPSSILNSSRTQFTTPVPVVSIAKELGKVLLELAEEELGVNVLHRLLNEREDHIQDSLNEDADSLLKDLSLSVKSRLERYSSLVTTMSSLASNNSRSPHNTMYQSYNPCCLLPDHILMYDNRYGCGVNVDLWCDAGYGRGDNPLVMGSYKAPPSSLTHSFFDNAQDNPELMWQYYMSRDGLHTEFPAHRIGDTLDDIGVPRCNSHSRHQRVFHSTLRPQGRSLVVAIDIGRGTIPRTLDTFISIGEFFLSGMGVDDTISLYSVSSEVSFPLPDCKHGYVYGTLGNVKSLLSFIRGLSVDRGSTTNHTLALATAFSFASKMQSSFQRPVLVVYMSSGAVGDGAEVVISSLQQSVPSDSAEHVRLAVLAGDNRHLRASEYNSRLHFLQCIASYPEWLSGEVPDVCSPAYKSRGYKIYSQTLVENKRSLFLPINNTDITPPIHRVFDLLGEPPLPPTLSPPVDGAGVRFIAFPWESLQVLFSTPYWDEDGKVVVVSISRGVPCRETLCGVVGVDVPLSTVLQDIIHTYNAPHHLKPLVINSEGVVVYHPLFGYPDEWKAPVKPVLLTDIEKKISKGLFKNILRKQKGHNHIDKQSLNIWWQHIGDSIGGWILILIHHDKPRPGRFKRANPSRQSKRDNSLDQSEREYSFDQSQQDYSLDQSEREYSFGQSQQDYSLDQSELVEYPTNVSVLPPSAIYHRLDLLPPERAKICRQFTQMATLDAPTVFLSSRAFTIKGRSLLFTPSQSMMGGVEEEERRIASIMRYLMGGNEELLRSGGGDRPHFYIEEENFMEGNYASETETIKMTGEEDENPGLNDWVREDISALYSVAENWKRSYELNSTFVKYIIRRFGILDSGGVVEYPGLLYSADMESSRYDWWLQQTMKPTFTTSNHQNDGKYTPKVKLMPPKVDESGSGYAITASVNVLGKLSSKVVNRNAILAADMSLGYWQRLLISLHPACDTTGLYLTVSGIGIRCFLMDEDGYLILHPSVLQPSMGAHRGNNRLHITAQEPLLSMSLLDPGDGREPPLRKEVCGEWWRSKSERRYKMTLKEGEVFDSNSGGVKHCINYQLVAVPNSNLFLGVINQTCAATTAFCPCSLVDNLCLNCQFVASKSCECPCECIMTDNSMCSANFTHTKSSNLQTIDSSIPLCAPSSHQPVKTLNNHQVGLLNELRPCNPTICSNFSSRPSCLGIPGCEWCMLTPIATVDNTTSEPNTIIEEDSIWALLSTPSCVPHHQCPGGVRGGGASLYPRGIAPQPHHEESYHISRTQQMPVAPVIGVVLCIILTAGVAAVYCYINNQGLMGSLTVTSRPVVDGGYTSASLVAKSNNMTTSLEDDIIADHDLEAAAVMSPYRVNPAYRRPPGPGVDPSDPGYSTMTQMDDVQNPTSSASSSSQGIGSQPTSKLTKHRQHAPTTRNLSDPSSAKKKSGKQYLSAKRAKSIARTGLQSQPEEESEEDEKESSSTSGIFKGLASSSLLSGNHEPPRFDWSPDEMQQYFGDLDAKNRASGETCTTCEGDCECEVLVWRCRACGTSNGVDDNSSSCCKCGAEHDHRPHRSRGSSKRSKDMRKLDGGVSSDCIESDLNSDVASTSNDYGNLSSPKKIGPNKVIVPVTVHMVDSL